MGWIDAQTAGALTELIDAAFEQESRKMNPLYLPPKTAAPIDPDKLKDLYASGLNTKGVAQALGSNALEVMQAALRELYELKLMKERV